MERAQSVLIMKEIVSFENGPEQFLGLTSLDKYGFLEKWLRYIVSRNQGRCELLPLSNATIHNFMLETKKC